ncbi:hypothetical protein JCGZ_14810 [Jatropha curcas]|uniref:Receptor-like serine/threonine-protein kinase n=1 Tax=Jatropha curcas TaxID=180498 RepID=A0A067KH46_JATCU|nr:hypothetical protein JCGZ_14810 [Jatropha curcas]
MATSLVFLALPLLLSSPLLLISAFDNLTEDSSLSVDNTNDVLISPKGTFIAGFFPVGINAYCFAIWYNEPFCTNNCTIVWMANRDAPVNGKRSKLTLQKSGNLILTDAGQLTVWSTDTVSESLVRLSILDNGNLVLQNLEGFFLWQSFNFPTNTILTLQALTGDKQLVSSRSESNYSSGFFKLYFDTDNVLRLLYDGVDTQSIYWPDPEILSFTVGRNTYNNSRSAFLDILGNFSSSDAFHFRSADYGLELQRRLTIDSDGNLRLYSRADERDKWSVSWQAMSDPCRIHGICGPNSACSYDPYFGRKCSCLTGFKFQDAKDWSMGCEPEFSLSCSPNETTYIQLTHLDFYGYDYRFSPNETLDLCKSVCSERCDCQGFQFRFTKQGYPDDVPYCFVKPLLLNGHRSVNFPGNIYLKVPKTSPLNFPSIKQIDEVNRLDCSGEVIKQLDRVYTKSQANETVRFILWFTSILGIVEFLVIFFTWWFLLRTHQDPDSTIGKDFLQNATGFRRFTYDELKKVTRGFSQEIGRGAGGIIYKGILSDQRVAAVKQLINEASDQGEAEFWAEVSIIGKLNHMNLIEIWGYCAEGKHRLLVYKYMENGSLAENVSSNRLDWEKRFSIALGTAKGLAYLHEECLDWVLHCDVKPQNILLDSDYQPKVSDFGLSRPLKKDNNEVSKLSRIRGTRGYIAPEWVFNQPITSKVDVYSYGMVLLEIVTGKNPTAVEDRRLVSWVKETINDASNNGDLRMQMILDAKLEGEYDKIQVEILVGVALKCVEEDKDARPTMKQVVEMLLCNQKVSK